MEVPKIQETSTYLSLLIREVVDISSALFDSEGGFPYCRQSSRLRPEEDYTSGSSAMITYGQAS
jgi:hypothetical protein